jgi:hypothetical protein
MQQIEYLRMRVQKMVGIFGRLFLGIFGWLILGDVLKTRGFDYFEYI